MENYEHQVPHYVMEWGRITIHRDMTAPAAMFCVNGELVASVARSWSADFDKESPADIALSIIKFCDKQGYKNVAFYEFLPEQKKIRFAAF